MILKVNSNENFNLQIKLDVSWDIESITILVILDNYLNGKRQMKQYHGNEFKEAMKQYKYWEQMLF